MPGSHLVSCELAVQLQDYMTEQASPLWIDLDLC